MDEITKVLVEDITPTLETLTRQQRSYDKWVEVKTEAESLSRLLIAYEYFRASRFLEDGTQQQQKRNDSLSLLRTALSKAKKDLQRVSDKIAEEQREVGEFKELEGEVSHLGKEVVGLESQLKHAKEGLAGEKKQKKSLTAAVKEMESSLNAKRKELEGKAKECEEKEKKFEIVQASLADAQRGYQSVTTGMIVTAEGNEKTVTQDLMDKKRLFTERQTQIQEMEMRISHLEKSLKAKKHTLSSLRSSSSDLEQSYQKAVKKIEKLKSDLSQIRFDPAREQQLRSDLQRAEEDLKGKRRQLNDMSASASSFDFHYSDPVSHFDRKKVKGMIGTLISIKEEEAVTALEVGAGGRLYNVVVDSEVTGKLLLEKGHLKRRVTIIPLNKIDANRLTKEQLKRAEAITRGREGGSRGEEREVAVAIDLIDYDAELEPAMRYAFGRFFVCKDNASAKAVAFDDQIKSKAVTLEGIRMCNL